MHEILLEGMVWAEKTNPSMLDHAERIEGAGWQTEALTPYGGSDFGPPCRNPSLRTLGEVHLLRVA